MLLLYTCCCGDYTQSFVYSLLCCWLSVLLGATHNHSCSVCVVAIQPVVLGTTHNLSYTLYFVAVYLLFWQKSVVDWWCCCCIPAVLCASQIISVLFMLLLYIYCFWRCTHSFMYCLCCCCISIVLGAEHNFLCTLLCCCCIPVVLGAAHNLTCSVYVVVVYLLFWALHKSFVYYLCCCCKPVDLKNPFFCSNESFFKAFL